MSRRATTTANWDPWSPIALTRSSGSTWRFRLSCGVSQGERRDAGCDAKSSGMGTARPFEACRRQALYARFSGETAVLAEPIIGRWSASERDRSREGATPDDTFMGSRYFYSSVRIRTWVGTSLTLRNVAARPTRLHRPTAAVLTLAKLRSILASRIRLEQLARIEPVHCPRAREDLGPLARELRIVRAATVPKCVPIGPLAEAQDFLHATAQLVATTRNGPGTPTRSASTRRSVS
jgi:hypothetical protein